MKAGHLSLCHRGLFLIVTTAFLFSCPLLPQARAQLGSETVYRFVYAIYQNDTNTALRMLESNTNLAYCNYGGDMGGDILPLLEASAAGNFGLVKRLLELGVDVNAEGRIWSGGSRMTALDEAVQHRRLEVCELLLEAGANPNHWSFQQSTLHLAFENSFYNSAFNRNAIATALLEYGADPFAEAGYYKTTPFELAISKGDGRLIPLMLDTGRKIKSAPKKSSRVSPRSKTTSTQEKISQILSARGTVLLSMAAQRGEMEAVDALLKAGVSARTNVPTELPVLQAFALSAAEAAKSRDAAVNQLEQTRQRLKELSTNLNPEFLASMRSEEADQVAKVGDLAVERWLKIRDLLIKNGADYDAFAATALGDRTQAEKLLSADKNVLLARNRDGETPLHWAVKTDRLPFVSFWMQSGVPLATTNFAGQTALHLAAANGKIEFVKALLAAKAPTGIRDTNGWTPLDAAIEAKQSEVIRVLMADKSAPAHPERGFATTLHKAAAAGDVAALTVLTETETNLEARNELGLTPLHVAGQAGQLGAAAFLIDRGADVNARDPDGNTVLDQILLSRTHWVKGRPSDAWVERRKKNPSQEKFWRVYNTPSGYTSPRELAASVAFFLACGADTAATNHAGQTILQLVTADSTMLWDYDRNAILPLLQQSGDGLNERDADGNTALHRLSTGFYDGNKVDSMVSLIASGANVNATNNLGQTPLHVASEKITMWDNNDPPINNPFQLLIYKKADVNARDNEGRTPMDVVAASDSSFKSEAMALLIQAGAKSNEADRKGRTSVHQALTGDWPWQSAGENLQQLAKAGADFSAKDKDGKTPLHYLAALGDQRPMFFIRGVDQVFITAKVDFNARDNEGNTPLIIAIKTGTMDVFDWLVKQGADLDATNNVGQTPRMLALKQNNQTLGFRRGTPSNSAELDIFQAIREGKDRAVERILNTDPQLANTPDRAGQTPLRVAAMLNRTNIISLLNTRGARWDAPSAVVAGRADLVKKILKDQPSAITELANGESLLHLAAISGDVDIIQQLLAANADLQAVDSFGLSPLGRARLKSQTDAVNLLAAHGATNNYFDAICLNDDKSVSQFLSRDKSLANATNRAKVTPVEIAAAAGFTQVLQALLKAGGYTDALPAPAHPNSASNFPFNRPMPGMFPFNWTTTPLNLAVFHNRTNAVEVLIRAGADVNQADSRGFAPLHFAVLRDNLQTLSLLLQHKANPNAASAQLFPFSRPRMPRTPEFDRTAADSLPPVGETPLHLATMLGKTNIIELLLKSGADVNVTNSESLTPLDEAEMTGRSFRINIPPPAMLKPLEPLGLFQEQVSISSVSPENLKGAAAMIRAAGGKHSAKFETQAARFSPSPNTPAARQMSALADGTEYHNRGCSNFDSHNFTNALADFRKSAELGSDYQDYTYYRIWIIRSRLGEKEEADRELTEYLAHRKTQNSNDWPLQVGRYLAGQSAESNFLAAAESPVPKTAKERIAKPGSMSARNTSSQEINRARWTISKNV